MKITQVETFLVKPRWIFLKIHTDEGLVGLGEPILEGRALTCATAVEELAPSISSARTPRASSTSSAGDVPPRLLSRRAAAHQRFEWGRAGPLGSHRQGHGRASTSCSAVPRATASASIRAARGPITSRPSSTRASRPSRRESPSDRPARIVESKDFVDKAAAHFGGAARGCRPRGRHRSTSTGPFRRRQRNCSSRRSSPTNRCSSRSPCSARTSTFSQT